MKYTIEEIRQMQEGQTFDCKSILIEPKHLATIIVAMANADGGMIAVGISDKTRRIEGVNQDRNISMIYCGHLWTFVFHQFLSLRIMCLVRMLRDVITVYC